jgi:hypothetical protein|tara:strand:+ start:357 stop:1325 length:969 start_codon:yes stop_codon:yes gene_type:complete
MADIVELMDFWPMDDDENIGFVAADSDFQLWLIAGIGVGFEDISYSVIDGPDDSGIYELIMDYDDYINLQDLYSEYLETGWAGLEEEDFDEVFAMNNEEGSTPVMDPMDFGEPVNWTPMDGTPSLKRRKDAEGSGEINIGPVYVEKKVPVLFKHDYATKDYEWSTDEPSYLTDDQEYELVEIVEQIVEDSDEEEGDESFDEDDYKGEVTWNTYMDDGRFYDLGAESANPSGGATGDQIISWEHNGLSSPSGPPSDIFWSEDFDAQMGHSRFQKSDNPRRDMSDTRRRLKQEMFSDVSGVVTLKNMAILGLAGITGYLLAGRK